MKTTTRWIAAALLLSAISAITAGQTVTERKSMSIEGAKRVIAAAVAYAKKNNAPGGVIAVVDDGGNLMALERLDGTFAAGATISIGKARTAVLFKRPTKVFEDLIRNGRTAMTALPDSLASWREKNNTRRARAVYRSNVRGTLSESMWAFSLGQLEKPDSRAMTSCASCNDSFAAATVAGA